MTTHQMTGAELQTLREACGLTREHLATLKGVQARTIKHWENGRAGVPADVQQYIEDVDHLISDEEHNELERLTQQRKTHPGAPMVLVRYREAADTAPHLAHFLPLPATVHAMALARLAKEVRRTPWGPHRGPWEKEVARIVWFEPEAFAAWCAVHKQPDTTATRNQWAAHTLPTQAIPHRAEQPPA